MSGMNTLVSMGFMVTWIWVEETWADAGQGQCGEYYIDRMSMHNLDYQLERIGLPIPSPPWYC